MMSKTFTAEHLVAHLNQDIAICRELLGLLQQEQTALQERDTDTLETLVEKKLPLLEALDSSAQLRQQWAQSTGIISAEEGWAELLEKLSNTDVKKQWETVVELYSETRKQNEINGKLLSRHQQTVTRILDVMRGKTAGPSLYTAAGSSSSYANSTKVGEA